MDRFSRCLVTLTWWIWVNENHSFGACSSFSSFPPITTYLKLFLIVVKIQCLDCTAVFRWCTFYPSVLPMYNIFSLLCALHDCGLLASRLDRVRPSSWLLCLNSNLCPVSLVKPHPYDQFFLWQFSFAIICSCTCEKLPEFYVTDSLAKKLTRQFSRKWICHYSGIHTSKFFCDNLTTFLWQFLFQKICPKHIPHHFWDCRQFQSTKSRRVSPATTCGNDAGKSAARRATTCEDERASSQGCSERAGWAYSPRRVTASPKLTFPLNLSNQELLLVQEGPKEKKNPWGCSILLL